MLASVRGGCLVPLIAATSAIGSAAPCVRLDDRDPGQSALSGKDERPIRSVQSCAVHVPTQIGGAEPPPHDRPPGGNPEGTSCKWIV